MNNILFLYGNKYTNSIYLLNKEILKHHDVQKVTLSGHNQRWGLARFSRIKGNSAG